ncbi:hypothetical protein NEDG_01606 [Nematocida displodere]|uniref:Saccharopine dehydrogenase NADP binding domain-containing protein n=1 Tax=Nematocida displodere TaxID=1805483 RepID=A0A177EGU8_9MICR|nr:hypothetical protein NEDG_01606 [Nematocida displodere]
MVPKEKKETNTRKDILICGGNGFTAQKLLEYIVEQRPRLKIGVTCRNAQKLAGVFKGIELATHKSLDGVSKHIVGVDDPKALSRVFKKYRVVINCIGPFAHTGLQIVDAAIKAKTHYIDCTGEPGFMGQSMAVFSDKALAAGVMVVHACGFDSLPIDIGMVYTMKEIGKSKEVVEAYAESYMHLVNARINLGTFRTIITSLDLLKGRKPEKKALAKEHKPTPSAKRRVKKMPFFSKKTNMYALIFPGSDSFVLRETRKKLGGIYPNCHCYISVSTIFGVFCTLMLGLLVGLVYLLPNALREVAYKYIDILSFGRVRSQGPSDNEIACSAFQTKIFIKGVDKTGEIFNFQTMVSGPDPGYVTTPVALLVSAETILANEKTSLKKTRGIFTPGAAFSETDIIPRLAKEQIVFSTLPVGVRSL